MCNDRPVCVETWTTKSPNCNDKCHSDYRRDLSDGSFNFFYAAPMQSCTAACVALGDTCSDTGINYVAGGSK